MKFDARAAKQLAPGAHIIMSDQPGLRLHASATGRAWIYRYKSPIDGKMRQVKIGSWPKLSAPAAIVEWERLRAAREDGADLSAQKRQMRAQAQAEAVAALEKKRADLYTVRALCNDYLDGHIRRARKEKGALEVRRLFERMLGDFADLPAASVRRSQAFDLLESHLDTPVLCAQLRSELGAAWNYGLDAGRLPETSQNWWRQIMRGKIKSKGKLIDGVRVGTVKRVLSDSETATLLRWFPNFPRNVVDVLTFYLWTGTRGAEIMGMRVEEVSEEPDGLWWTVPKGRTKNARHQNATDLRVPLVGRALDVALRRIERVGSGYLFLNQARTSHLDQSAVSFAVNWYQPYCKSLPGRDRPRLPVTHWSPHDLRRTTRTMLAALGCPEAVAESILGHMQPGIVGVYNRHSYDKERRAWLTKLDVHLESLARR